MKHNAFFLPATLTTQLSKAFRLTLFMLITLCLTSTQTKAQTYFENTVHSFYGTDADGSLPVAGLIDLNGTLYGTTQRGGTDDVGVVFSIDEKTYNEPVFDTFITENGYGGNPTSALVNVSGILYGTTANFGANGDGTIFSLDPDTGTETVVHNFAGISGQNDGASPQSSLINLNGILYGTTYKGGIYNEGTVYSFDPSTNTEKDLYSFGVTSSDGSSPQADLVAVNGILYGTTYIGGSNNFGTVFSLDPITRKQTTLYKFSGNPDGNDPYGGLIAVDGKLYGATFGGGTANSGTVYSIDLTTNKETVLHSFTGSTGDGANPQCNLILVNGKLYGTTAYGGVDAFGTVFSVDPTTGTETIVYNFTDSTGDGANPFAGLVNVNGILYGTTKIGGTYGQGMVFSLTPVSPPTAVNHYVNVKYNTTLNDPAPGVLGGVNDGGSSPMTAALVTNVTHGTLSLKSDGSFVYAPNTGFLGNDTFTYQASNAIGTSNVATCTLMVKATVPNAPNHYVKVTPNTALTDPAPGVLGGVNNGGSTPVTAALVANITHGTLTLKSDGSFVYTPNTGYLGNDTFTYQAVNSIGKSNIATVYLTVHPTAPIAVNHFVKVNHNTTLNDPAPGVLGGANNGGSSPMTAALVAKPTHSSLTLNTNGSFVYTPTTGFSGADSFTYQAANAVGKSNIATVYLTVQ